MDVNSNIQGLIFNWYKIEDYSGFPENSQQNHRKCWCKGDYSTTPLYMPFNKLLPFQIKRNYNSVPVASLNWKIINLNTGVENDLMSLLPAGFITLEIKSDGYNDWIIYYASESFTSIINDGVYYCVINDGINYFESEVFQIGAWVDPQDVEGILLGEDGGIIIEDHGSYNDYLLSEAGDFVLP